VKKLYQKIPHKARKARKVRWEEGGGWWVELEEKRKRARTLFSCPFVFFVVIFLLFLRVLCALCG
jgi:hypothetical protein